MTPAGRGSLTVGVAITLLGLVIGYPAVTSMGSTLIAAVVIALILVGRPSDTTLERKLIPDRVTEGESFVGELTITNRGRRTSSAARGAERFGDRDLIIRIPALDPGESVVIANEIRADHRGVFDVGPLRVRTGDPIGLARRGGLDSEVGRVVVHPRLHDVSPFPAGRHRDLEGIPSGAAAEGGITFADLRDYVPGDDLRLIHWRSSARAGKLTVRHNVDVHRPRTSVILDTTRAVYSHEAFEDAVRAAASIAASAMRHRFPFTVRTSDGWVIDDRSPRLAVLDFFAAVEPADQQADLAVAALAASREPSGWSCALITGRAGVDALRSFGPLRHRFEQLTMVRMGSDERSQVYDLAGALLINSATSEDFAHAWNRRMRR